MQTIRCPRENCERVRTSPCSATCYLTSGRHHAEMLREAEVMADRREMARQRNEERMRDAGEDYDSYADDYA